MQSISLAGDANGSRPGSYAFSNKQTNKHTLAFFSKIEKVMASLTNNDLAQHYYDILLSSYAWENARKHICWKRSLAHQLRIPATWRHLKMPAFLATHGRLLCVARMQNTAALGVLEVRVSSKRNELEQGPRSAIESRATIALPCLRRLARSSVDEIRLKDHRLLKIMILNPKPCTQYVSRNPCWHAIEYFTIYTYLSLSLSLYIYIYIYNYMCIDSLISLNMPRVSNGTPTAAESSSPAGPSRRSE